MSDLAETAPQYVDLARTALEEIAPSGTIGDFHGVVTFDPNVVFLQFANTHEAYRGWYWTAAVGRPDELSTPTVLETELLPGDDALLAPQWISWAERFAEYQAEHAKASDDASNDASDNASNDETTSEDDEDASTDASQTSAEDKEPAKISVADESVQAADDSGTTAVAEPTA